MDPITHMLSGSAMSRTGLGKKYGAPVFLALFIGAILPDIDHFLTIGKNFETYIRLHRGITHSFLGSAIMAYLLALIIFYSYKRFKPSAIEKVNFKVVFFASLAGHYMHILLDLITSFGTMINEPFTDERYTLNLVFIIDLVVTLIFFASTLSPAICKKRGFIVARVWLGFFFLYLLFSFAMNVVFIKTAKNHLLSLGEDIEKARVTSYPAPPHPFKRMVIAETSGKYYVLRYNFFSLEEKEVIKKETHPLLENLKNNETYALYKWFAHYPSLKVTKEADLYLFTFFDLRFYSLPPSRPFELKLYLDNKGNVVMQSM